MRTEVNVITGEVKQVSETPGELAAAVIATAQEAAANTPDNKAMRAADGMDRLQFDVLFAHENRLRVLESKAPVTQQQFRDALIARWKVLNP